jgi:trk system potassium uptake protein TrkA
MNLIIVGCGRVGTELAHTVAAKGHDVVIVDRDPQAFHSLDADFQGRTVQGDIRDREVMIRAGVENADGFAAITPDDEINMVAAHAARTFFNVPNVVARVYDPVHTQVFSLANLQTVISSSWSAHRMEQLLTHPGINELASIGNGEASIIEVQIPDHMVGKPLAYISEKGKYQPSVLVRGGSAILAREELLFEDGDLTVITVMSSHLSKLESLLSPKES